MTPPNQHSPLPAISPQWLKPNESRDRIRLQANRSFTNRTMVSPHSLKNSSVFLNGLGRKVHQLPAPRREISGRSRAATESNIQNQQSYIQNGPQAAGLALRLSCELESESKEVGVGTDHGETSLSSNDRSLSTSFTSRFAASLPLQTSLQFSSSVQPSFSSRRSTGTSRGSSFPMPSSTQASPIEIDNLDSSSSNRLKRRAERSRPSSPSHGLASPIDAFIKVPASGEEVFPMDLEEEEEEEVASTHHHQQSFRQRRGPVVPPSSRNHSPGLDGLSDSFSSLSIPELHLQLKERLTPESFLTQVVSGDGSSRGRSMKRRCQGVVMQGDETMEVEMKEDSAQVSKPEPASLYESRDEQMRFRSQVDQQSSFTSSQFKFPDFSSRSQPFPASSWIPSSLLSASSTYQKSQDQVELETRDFGDGHSMDISDLGGEESGSTISDRMSFQTDTSVNTASLFETISGSSTPSSSIFRGRALHHGSQHSEKGDSEIFLFYQLRCLEVFLSKAPGLLKGEGLEEMDIASNKQEGPTGSILTLAPAFDVLPLDLNSIEAIKRITPDLVLSYQTFPSQANVPLQSHPSSTSVSNTNWREGAISQSRTKSKSGTNNLIHSVKKKLNSSNTPSKDNIYVVPSGRGARQSVKTKNQAQVLHKINKPLPAIVRFKLSGLSSVKNDPMFVSCFRSREGLRISE